MEPINSEPMLTVEDAVIELQRLSSLCCVITWMSDEGGRSELTAVGDAVELLRRGLDTQIRTLDHIQW